MIKVEIRHIVQNTSANMASEKWISRSVKTVRILGIRVYSKAIIYPEPLERAEYLINF